MYLQWTIGILVLIYFSLWFFQHDGCAVREILYFTILITMWSSSRYFQWVIIRISWNVNPSNTCNVYLRAHSVNAYTCGVDQEFTRFLSSYCYLKLKWHKIFTVDYSCNIAQGWIHLESSSSLSRRCNLKMSAHLCQKDGHACQSHDPLPKKSMISVYVIVWYKLPNDCYDSSYKYRLFTAGPQTLLLCVVD